MSLDEIRVHIDAVDTQIKKLFIERMDCARQVAEAKAKTGGDVFVQSREDAIISSRTQDVDNCIKSEYSYFLLLLMSLSRRYQYGLLSNMQESVLNELSKKSGLDLSASHSKIKISFSCDIENSKLALLMNMAVVNNIAITQMQVTSDNSKQMVEAILSGNINDENMKRLICQLGKELQNFTLVELC